MLGLNSRFTGLLFLLFSAQCQWSQPPAKDTIVFALSSEPKTLDPRFATDAGGQRVGQLIFSSLINIGPDLKMQGNLASQWSYDNRIYTFTLKPGIQFHNGRKANHEDFIFSVNEYKKGRSPFSSQFSVIKRVEATYDHKKGGSLRLFLSDFSAPFLQNIPSLRLLPKQEVLEKGDDFYASPLGTGPFKFEKKDIKNIFLTRNENYFSDKAKIKRIQFKIIKDSTTRFQKMYKGKIDIIQSDVPFSKVRFFQKQTDFNVVISPGLSINYILLNLRKPLLAQSEVRHAISSAVDRKDLIKYTLEGFAEEATSIVPNKNTFHHSKLSYQHYSEEKVRKIFEKYKDQKVILKTSNTQGAIETGRIITHQLKAMGFPVSQQTYEWGTYYEDVRTGNFDMAIMKWVGVNDPDIYRVSLHSKMIPPGRNRGYYNNPRFDSLVDKAFKEPDTIKRKELYMKAQEIVFADLPTIPLWYEKQVAIVHNRVKDYELPINGDFSALMKVHK